MDALQMLESEHDDLEALLVKLERTHGTEARHVFLAVKDQHEMIEVLEETYIYPSLQNNDLTQASVLEGLEEHRVIDTFIQELTGVKPDELAWRPKVHLLTMTLEHHVRAEESELFPKIRLVWDSDKLTHLYRKMEQLKAKRKKEKESGLQPA
jgi:hemerythrin superfamily protein